MSEYLINAKKYWNAAAADPDVRTKYIADEWAETDKIIELLEKYNDDWSSVIEIGCGIGRLIVPLADKYDGKYVGVDIAADMLELAPKRDNIAYTTVFAGGHEESFIYSILVFQHIPQDVKEKYIEYAYRSLKDGGKFLFQYVVGKENDPYSYQVSVKDMRDAMKNVGFKNIKTERGFLHKDWAIICGTK